MIFPIAFQLLASRSLSWTRGVLEDGDSLLNSFTPQASLMGSGTELGVRACFLDEDAAFLTLADDMKSSNRESLAAHRNELNLGKLF